MKQDKIWLIVIVVMTAIIALMALDSIFGGDDDVFAGHSDSAGDAGGNGTDAGPVIDAVASGGGDAKPPVIAAPPLPPPAPAPAPPEPPTEPAA